MVGDVAGILLFWDGSYLFDAIYKSIFFFFFLFRIDEHCEMRRDKKSPDFKFGGGSVQALALSQGLSRSS